MRKLLILACLVTSPLCAEEQEFQYAPYELLSDYPNCSGPGHIAYRTTFEVMLENGLYPVGEIAPVCSITVRRGDKREEIETPCEGAARDAVETEDFLVSDEFCPATQELRPATIAFKGELIGCISMAGHSFIGGNWQTTTTRPQGTTVVRGAYDDSRLDVEYFVGDNGENTFFAPSLNIWLELDDETLPSLPKARLRSVGFTQFLPLVDQTRARCRFDPKSCWLEGKMSMEISEGIIGQERARICAPFDDHGLAFITRDVPEGEGN